MTDEPPQKRINQEDQPVGRRHDREDIFPDEDNSSYRYTKFSPGKKFSRKLGWISDILHITEARQTVCMIFQTSGAQRDYLVVLV
jgi:hypothetical protein